MLGCYIATALWFIYPRTRCISIIDLCCTSHAVNKRLGNVEEDVDKLKEQAGGKIWDDNREFKVAGPH